MTSGLGPSSCLAQSKLMSQDLSSGMTPSKLFHQNQAVIPVFESKASSNSKIGIGQYDVSSGIGIGIGLCGYGISSFESSGLRIGTPLYGIGTPPWTTTFLFGA